ncbi:spermatogenesis-associated protein 13-like [Neosynchiropus ocellatus]
MRSTVIQEIMDVERSYTKRLEDICAGYIGQCRNHPNMFTEQQLRVLFSNVEEIFSFQRKFLQDLELRYNQEEPQLSEIGSCFLIHRQGFAVYSEYCNSHQAACAELYRLLQQDHYKYFFEACRLLQQMNDLSINSFLIAPVQKICKYPLQLEELLKCTPKEHDDYTAVSEACHLMRNVAVYINERKRRFESVNSVAEWQVGVHHWQGSNVLDRSSEMIHSGELIRIARRGKIQHRVSFLFDHQLVFCKKDIFRRDFLLYRGRLDMDEIQVTDLPDGWNTEVGVEVRNAMRLYHVYTLEFVCVLCCRKLNDKLRWFEAFTKEKNAVNTLQEMGMDISEEQRKQALVNARSARSEKMKGLGYFDWVLHHNYWPIHHPKVVPPMAAPEEVLSEDEATKGRSHRLLQTMTRCSFFRD